MAIKLRVTRLERASDHQKAPSWFETLTDEGREANRILYELVDQLGKCDVETFKQKIEEAEKRRKPLREMEEAAKIKAGVTIPRNVVETIERHSRGL